MLKYLFLTFNKIDKYSLFFIIKNTFKTIQ